MTTRKILIMGLPGAGKTTLATELAKRLNAVHFNADLVRENINRDLGFSEVDRIEHARRMGWLCDRVTETGAFAIADFICPTRATREAFMAGGPALVVFVDRIQAGAYADTNALFVPPRGREADIVVTRAGGPEWWAERIAMLVEVAVRSAEANGSVRGALSAIPRGPPRTDRRKGFAGSDRAASQCATRTGWLIIRSRSATCGRGLRMD